MRTDQELIERANRGEADAFEALYLRYRDWVVRVASRYAPDGDAALDAAQETFLYFLRQFPGFELRAKVTTYLYPIARNIALTQQRQARRRTQAAEADFDTLPSKPERSDQLTEDVQALLAQLPLAQREVVLMRFVDGLTLEEIAGVLKIPLGTAKSRLHHGLGKLREDPRFGDGA